MCFKFIPVETCKILLDMNETMETTNNFLNIVLILIGVFDVLMQRLHDNDRIVKAKNRKVFCFQEFLKQK